MKKTILALSGIAFLSSVVASDIYVSSSGEYGPLDADKYTDLSEAVAAAQDDDTVWIEDGYVYDAAEAAKEISTGNGLCRVVVSKSITLRSESGDATTGEGATIRGAWHDATTGVGANAVRALGINAKNVVILGLVLENGGTPAGRGGGGLYLSGNASAFVTNCVIRNSSTAYGGGVYVSNSDILYLSGCVVTNNASLDWGGGVCTYNMRNGGMSHLDGCLIADNTCASRGGGVSGGAGLVMDSCVVSNNAAGNGGGVYSLYLTATNCLFAGNTAGNGGGVSGVQSNKGTLSFVGTTFFANHGITGGGVWDNEKTAMFESCSFVSNVAKIAGGVYGGTNYQSVVFSGNAATNGNGGAIHFLSAADASDLTVTGNTASSKGGGLVMTANLRVTVADSVISENAAYEGGGVYAPSAVFTNVVFASNRAARHGGGVYGGTGAQRPVLYGCVVSNNAAAANLDRAASGGGIWGAVAFDSLIACNTTLGSGGGASDSVLTRCTLQDNVAVDSSSYSSFGGGANKCIATNSVFSGNVVEGPGTRYGSGCGGGAYDLSGVGNVFSGNGAKLYGGGVNLVAGNMLACSVFSNNTAKTSAGGIYGVGSLYNSLIVGNVVTNATGGGAAAGAAGSAGNEPYALTLVNCTVADNVDETGKGRGGVYQVSMTNTVVWGNTGLDDAKVTAVSSCAAILTAGTNGNIADNPLLDEKWRPKRKSPCISAATVYAWMSDPADARSRDVYGNARVNQAPDMGAVEFFITTPHFLMFIR